MIPSLEFLAILSGATFGILLARSQGMDFAGAFTLALVTAFGGGTIRDLLLDRHPIFWIGEARYAVIVFCLVLATSFVRTLSASIERYLNLPDAMGLGLYAIAGTGYAIAMETPVFVAVLLGVVTGIFGGIIGDVICNRIPSVFRPSSRLYATCAFVGCWVFVLLRSFEFSEAFAAPIGVVVVVALRLGALRWDWRLPGYQTES